MLLLGQQCCPNSVPPLLFGNAIGKPGHKKFPLIRLPLMWCQQKGSNTCVEREGEKEQGNKEENGRAQALDFNHSRHPQAKHHYPSFSTKVSTVVFIKTLIFARCWMSSDLQGSPERCQSARCTVLLRLQAGARTDKRITTFYMFEGH